MPTRYGTRGEASSIVSVCFFITFFAHVCMYVGGRVCVLAVRLRPDVFTEELHTRLNGRGGLQGKALNSSRPRKS